MRKNKISLAKQLEGCDVAISTQAGVVKTFANSEHEKEFLEILKAIRETIESEYLQQQQANKRTKSAGVNYE